MKKYFLQISIILLMASCQESEKKVVQINEYCLDEKHKEIIKLLSVTKENVMEQIHLTGNIVENFDKVSNFVSLINGVISTTYFSQGDTVYKGQVLAEMQSTELSLLQAELTSIEAQILIVEVDLFAKQQLFNDGISSNKELIELKSQWKVLQSDKKKIQATLSLFNADDTKGVFLIKAPSTGVITKKNINPGTTITDQGDILFSISDLSTLWAMADIYPSQIGYVNKDMQVLVKSPSYPDETFQGKIDLVSDILDDTTKVLKARINLDNKQNKLKPGMMIELDIFKEGNKRKIAVPTSSLIFSNSKNYVVVYNGDCDIEAREVQIASKINQTTYIENGLIENEEIITKNHLLIFESLNN